ncbi:MAG: beta-N-acetylhexosaminidase [Myxococcota bacterium]
MYVRFSLLALAACAGGGPDGVPGGGRDLDVPALVPLPLVVEDGVGLYTLDDDTVVAASDTEALAVAEQLAEAMRPSTGLPLPVEEGDAGGIVLVLADGLPAEGYTLDVDETGVVVTASDAAGLFYGTQTLLQLLSPWVYAGHAEGVAWEVPFVHVEDAPRFPWRGFMLDVARHFFTVDEVKRQIDLIAMHKMNRLHLHLTDDQGWRIEIESWPLLAEYGGATEVGHGQGGYYTQEEFADLVDYAAARHVTVVPEIDFPGHANAALSAYDELNESGFAADPYTGAPVLSTPLWLDGPDTHRMVEDVWREVAALTPGEWAHIGADEAIGIDEADYEAFVVWLQGVLAEEGKTIVGWDEIGGAGLAPPFVGQHWFDERRARTLVTEGGGLISSPAEHCYLDMRQDEHAEFGQTWAGRIDVERAYAWDPVPDGVAEADVLGVEGALWTEYVDDEVKLDLMAWPRLVSLAEVGWTADDQTLWPTFEPRLAWHGARLEVLGVGFYRSPGVDWVAASDAR